MEQKELKNVEEIPGHPGCFRTPPEKVNQFLRDCDDVEFLLKHNLPISYLTNKWKCSEKVVRDFIGCNFGG